MSPTSDLRLSGYLERPNEEVQILLQEPSGRWVRVGSTRSGTYAYSQLGSTWHYWVS
ncbi:MAG: hypothetical protein H6724_07295 [Sandaracinus sp.]|nr:hypothetical protein [Sandaracinus sp.]